MLCDKIPGQTNGVFFAIIPKGPVAQHFKPCQVAAIFTHFVQIIVLAPHAHTGLHGDGAGIAAGFKAQKHILKLIHPRIGK